MILKKIIAEQFKGVDHAEYDFWTRTLVTGRNGSGKTRLADMWFWLFADKDYSLKSAPEVHSDFLSESEPSVTAVCDINGREVTLRKFQKDSRTKKQKETGAPIRISNQYEINAVPKSQKDFFSYLTETGIDIDSFLLLSHPVIFTSQKSADCRKVLFGMVSDITDKEIADSMDGCEELGGLLENLTADEITAMKKREKKEADENLDAIPNQIVGLEKAKVVVDADEYQHEREKLQSEIDAIEKEIAENPVPSIGELNQKLVLLEKEERQLTVEANADRVEKLTAMDAEIGEMKRLLSEKEREMIQRKNNVSDALKGKNEFEKRYFDLSKEFQDVKLKEFALDTTTCPYCGQELPVHRLDEAKRHFEEDKRKRMDDINAEAKDIKTRWKKLESIVKEEGERISTLDKEIIQLQGLIADKSKLREPLERVITVDGSEEQQRIMQEILTVRRKIAERDDLVMAEDARRNEIRERQAAMRAIDDELAQIKVNERIDSQIADLQSKQKDYAQAKSDAERILYQLSQISMKKNELLTDQVNSHFTRVKFRLFVTQKNGDVKDDCTPLVLTPDGEYRDMTFSANTAAIVLAQLDIISGLQKFYGQNMPVFLDGAECLDDVSKSQIDIDTQLIMLCVSDGDLKVEEM